MLDLSLLQALVHSGFDLFPEGIHLVGLLLNQSCLGCHYLFVSLLHVPLTLLVLHLLSLDLDLVSLSVLLLAGKLSLNGLQVEQLGAELEGEGELLLKHLPIFLEITNVTLLECANRLLILSLHLSESIIPTLVEVLVLHQVCLLYLLALSRLIKDQLLPATIEVLDLQLLNTVLSHLCLHVLALHLALLAMFLKHGTKQSVKIYSFEEVFQHELFELVSQRVTSLKSCQFKRVMIH